MTSPIVPSTAARPPAARSDRSYLEPGRGEPQPELQLHRLGAVLRRRRWTVLLCLVAVLVATAALTRLWPATFTSSATLLVEPPPSQATPALDVLKRLGQGNTLSTEIELVQSGRVVAPVVDRFDLHATVEVDGSARPAAAVLPGFSAGRGAPPRELRLTEPRPGHFEIRDAETGALVREAAAGAAVELGELFFRLPAELPGEVVTVRVVPFEWAVARVRGQISAGIAHRDANLMQLQCSGATAEEARRLCAGVVDGYLALRTTLQRSEASSTAAFLRSQTERLGRQLATVEDSLEAYRQSQGIVALDEQVSATAAQYADLRAQRELVEAERVALAGLVRGSRNDRDLAGFPAFLQDPVVTQLLTSLIGLENRRSELRLLRAEGSPEVTLLDGRRSEIEAQLRSRAKAYEAGLAAKSGSLEEAMERSSARLSTIPAQQIRLTRLERTRTSLEETFRLLSTRLKEAEIAEAVDLPSVSVVDEASLPMRPSSPRPPLTLGLGLVLGLAFGLGVSLVQEHGDRRIHGRDELEQHTHLPIISMIPPVRGARRRGLAPGGRPLPGRGGEEEVAREAFRSLGVDLQFIVRNSAASSVRTLAITSAGPGEGKTFVSSNLALTRVADGFRTLLIDADLRANGVARTFGLPSTTRGLSDYLAGEVPLEAALTGLPLDGAPGRLPGVGPEEGNALWVMPAGTATARSRGTLSGSRFAELLAEVRRQFDLVIVDTPPLNVLADAATVSGATDAVVLVVRGGVTEREALALTLERLDRTGGRPLGIVLNDVRLPARYTSYSYAPAGDPGSGRGGWERRS